MKKILITGATGNVGKEVIKCLRNLNHTFDILAGLKDEIIEDDVFSVNKSTKFDFTDLGSFKPALTNIDILFLLRPPQISDVKKYFKPLIDTARLSGVKHIVFLSVQGVQTSKLIPHHKIEKLIVDSGISYTFLRPAYFMQNFIGGLKHDLTASNRIYLPAGNAKFTLVDASDIGNVAAMVLINTQAHLNTAYELTCHEKLSFKDMAAKLSYELGKPIAYVSPNLLSFFIAKRKEKMPIMLILVMIMLHYFPRFQREPSITDCIEALTGRMPASFSEFIVKNRALLIAR